MTLLTGSAAADAQAVNDQLTAIDKRLVEARKVRMLNLDAPRAERRAAIATLDAAVKRAKRELEELRSEGSQSQSIGYLNRALGTFKGAEADLVDARLIDGCVTPLEEVTAAHRKGQRARPADLAALDTASRAFVAQRSAWLEDTASEFRTLAKELIARDPQIPALVAEAARQKEEAGLAVLGDAAWTRLETLRRGLKQDAPIDDSALAAIEESVQAIEAKAPGRGGYYARELLNFRLLAAWQKPDGEAQAAAALLGGAIAASGRTAGKKVAIDVKAEADHCYLLLARFPGGTGAGQVGAMHDFSWDGRGGSLQTFGFWRPDWLGDAPGFCAVRAGRVSGTAALETVGSKSAARWVVLDWERAKVPAFVAARIYLHQGDPCDFDHWSELWTRPVPGTLAYAGAEPILLVSVRTDADGKPYLDDALSIAGVPASKDHLASKPPAAIQFSSEVRWDGCSRAEAGLSPTTKAINACYARIDKKHAGEWRRINATRDRAEQLGGISPSAEDAASRLKERSDLEKERACGPLEAKAEARFRKLVDDLVDRLKETTYQDPADRSGLIEQERKAPHWKR